MSFESVSRGKMQIFRLILLVSLLIRCRAGDESSDCVHNYGRDCVIEATFGSSQTNDTVDVLVKCSNHDELSDNQFSLVDSISWNGCNAWRDLNGFGLRIIPRKNRIKFLRIENFAIGNLASGTFDGFAGLEFLSLQLNSIKNLSSSCFRGLEGLRTLEMMDNQLTWMDSKLLTDMPRLKNLKVHDRRLLFIAKHQFDEHQIVDSVELEIYYIGMELLEHLAGHVRNLSISVELEDIEGCVQMRLNGYEKDWIVERLRLVNTLCGFVMENVDTIKSLELIRVMYSTNEFKLKNLNNLETIILHQNSFDKDFAKFDGNFANVKQFNLFNNSMTEIDLSVFEPFVNLREINLEGNFLNKMSGLSSLKENVRLLVDGNDFECSCLDDIATTTRAFRNFIFTESFSGFNMNGLSCRYDRNCPEHNETQCASCLIASANIEAQRELRSLSHDNFILKPEIFMIIVCASSLLGMAVTFISIYVYHKRRLMKQEPFYHSLRDSIIRPVHGVRSTLKEIISRNLPPTNYEHPISDSNVTEMTDVAANIYEEIPQELN